MFQIRPIVIVLIIACAISSVAQTHLSKNFKSPPLQARPKALWPWVNGNFNLSQITYELEEAKAKGMAGFDIWDVGTSMNSSRIIPDGPAFLSDESLQAIAHTIREADRLGMEIGLISSSSWNAGGHWIKPEHGAMGIFRSDTILQGPSVFKGKLMFPKIPTKYGRDHDVIINQDPVTGLPLYYKEIAMLAHPYSKDSILIEPNLIQLINHHDAQKELEWKVPTGRWRLIRYVCAPTGQPLMVPSPKSNGLMLDHFNAEAQQANMKYLFDRLKLGLGNLRNRSLKYLYEDSYEVNSAVWTAQLPEAFAKQNGYSLIPYLPLLDGFRFKNKDINGRFVYDFTKTLSNLIIDNHYKIGTSLSKAEGLGFYAEAGGPGQPIHNVPFEDLKALGSLTVPRGEFWNKHPQWQKLQVIKGIASAAHIYNQTYVEAESFTSVWLWQEGPGELKPLADRAMCEGLNRFVYHTFPHTPPESGMPGWVYNFGTLINTTNGWWSKSQGFHEYLGRCSYLLQQGNFVGDVAFYYGDQAPNFVPLKHFHDGLGLGYDYDVVNTEAILTKMSVKNGRIFLPHGQSYAILVLPQEQSINPAVLKKIKSLVAAGATVVGPKPLRSYSLHQYQQQDSLVKKISDELWDNVDSINVKEHQYGQGKIVWGTDLREVLAHKGIGPDMEYHGSGAMDTLDFIHRSTAQAEIYFIRNIHQHAINGLAQFRVQNAIPEYYKPETGEVFPIKAYEIKDRTIRIPLYLDAEGSCFIVFNKIKNSSTLTPPQPLPLLYPEMRFVYTSKGFTVINPTNSLTINTPWELRFQSRPGAPVVDTMVNLSSWHLSPKDGIKHYTGMVSYRNNFESPNSLDKAKRIILELGKVKEMAEVYLNGIKLGYHWHASNSFDISSYINPGENYLVIEVVNSINNFLIGEAKKPEEYRQYRSNIWRLPNAWSKPFAEASLIEAGLIGPVKINYE